VARSGRGFDAEALSILDVQFVDLILLFSFSSTFRGGNLVASFKSSNHG
jgi:hypothetical protein